LSGFNQQKDTTFSEKDAIPSSQQEKQKRAVKKPVSKSAKSTTLNHQNHGGGSGNKTCNIVHPNNNTSMFY